MGKKAAQRRKHHGVAQARPAASVHTGKIISRTDVLVAICLAAVTFAVYAQVGTHQFISLDDDLYIRDNAMVSGGMTLKGIAWAFTTFHAANWHPLTWLAHMLDAQLFGLNAGGHLLVNSLIHVSNTVLLFLFLRRVTRTTWQSAVVAGLFALHPLHVESVAWAAERKDTLATLFGLLSLLAYVRYVSVLSWRRYSLVALLLALGLMAKPMLVTWPFVLLLLDFWPLRRLAWQPPDGMKQFTKAWLPLIREKLPLFCLVGASMIITYIAQSHGGAVRGLTDAPISLRLSNALVSYAKYLFLTFWPQRLAVYYPFSPSGIQPWQIAAAFVVLAVITAVALREANKRPYLIMGWLWFVGTLVPVIGLVQVGGQAMADRYHYIPSIGLFIAIVFGAADLSRARRIGRTTLAAVTAMVILILACLTALQIRWWRDSVTLFERTLAITSDNLAIEYNLGHVLGEQKRYDEAKSHFATALRIKPDFFDALFNMGQTLSEQGQPAQAMSYYQQALAVKPSSARAHMQLGLVLVKEGRNDDALQHFYQARELGPNDSDIRANLGLMLARQGKIQQAIDELNQALRLNPDSAEAHNNLGLVLLAEGKAEESLPHFSAALRLKPDLAVARANLQRAQLQIEARRK